MLTSARSLWTYWGARFEARRTRLAYGKAARVCAIAAPITLMPTGSAFSSSTNCYVGAPINLASGRRRRNKNNKLIATIPFIQLADCCLKEPLPDDDNIAVESASTSVYTLRNTLIFTFFKYFETTFSFGPASLCFVRNASVHLV